MNLANKILVLAAGLSLLVPATMALAGNGNEAPSGTHYNLNLIGVPKDKTADMTGNGGARIFMPLDGTARIWLKEGADFEVLDANGTDSNGASFQLPNPDPTNSGTTRYSVFCRVLGKPGGGVSTITTGATLVETGVEYMSIYPLVLQPKSGKVGSFTNVSKELLYIYATITHVDGTTETIRAPLFDSRFQDFFWEYDNNGLKVVQLRFYPGVETTVPNP